MIKITFTQNAAEDVAKMAVFLAYNASNVVGMGIFQARDSATLEEVWNQAYNKLDYSGRHGMTDGEVDCDYVFGCMMKLFFTISAPDCIQIPGFDEPRLNHQSWCREYKTFTDLFAAAAKKLNLEIKTVEIIK